LKITDVECLVLDGDYPFVIVSTDEGITGYGECFRRSPEVSKAAIDTVFRPLVVRKDPFQTEAIFDLMLKAGSVSGPPGALLTAASGIDIALWDIKGKALGVPIYELLGGMRPGREKVRVYASSLVRDLSPTDEAKRAADFQENGFTGYKMHSAVPGAIDHPADHTVDSVREMRAAIGNEFDILVDVNSAYSVHHAIEIGKALEDLGVFHFEEPRPANDLEGLAQIADALTIPIASGEMIYDHFQYRDLILQGRVDIIQPDIVKVPGFTEFQKIATLASAFGIPITVHNTQPILSTVAHLHFCATSPMTPYAQEYNIEHISIRDEISVLKEPLGVIDGHIAVPDGAGLGVALDEAALKELASR